MARDSSENASLDEFFDDSGGADESESDDSEGTSDDHEKKPDEKAASEEPPVEAAQATARWSPEGACENCGTTATRLWHDDGQMVCPDCKAWE